MKEDNVQGKIN